MNNRTFEHPPTDGRILKLKKTLSHCGFYFVILHSLFYYSIVQNDFFQVVIEVIELEGKDLDIATQQKKTAHFWEPELYHQDYYDHKGGMPYCHGYTKRF